MKEWFKAAGVRAIKTVAHGSCHYWYCYCYGRRKLGISR